MKASNFDRCQHKETEFTPYEDYDSGIYAGKLVCPKTLERGFEIRVTATNAQLDPRLALDVFIWNRGKEGQHCTYNTADVAVMHLRKTAMALVCTGCTYPDMTIVEIAKSKADREAEALEAMKHDIRRAEIELEQRTAMGRLDELQQQLDRLPDQEP